MHAVLFGTAVAPAGTSSLQASVGSARVKQIAQRLDLRKPSVHPSTCRPSSDKEGLPNSSNPSSLCVAWAGEGGDANSLSAQGGDGNHALLPPSLNPGVEVINRRASRGTAGREGVFNRSANPGARSRASSATNSSASTPNPSRQSSPSPQTRTATAQESAAHTPKRTARPSSGTTRGSPVWGARHNFVPGSPRKDNPGTQFGSPGKRSVTSLAAAKHNYLPPKPVKVHLGSPSSRLNPGRGISRQDLASRQEGHPPAPLSTISVLSTTSRRTGTDPLVPHFTTL